MCIQATPSTYTMCKQGLPCEIARSHLPSLRACFVCIKYVLYHIFTGSLPDTLTIHYAVQTKDRKRMKLKQVKQTLTRNQKQTLMRIPNQILLTLVGTVKETQSIWR